MHVPPYAVDQDPATNAPPFRDVASTVLAAVAFLLPALGVPGDWMLQDTLKSAVLAIGTLLAAFFFIWQRRDLMTSLRWHGLLAIPVVLMTYALGSMVWSHPYLAGVEAARWGVLSLLLFLGLNTLDARNLPKLMWGIHAGALVASLWAATQFWWGWSFFPQAALPASSFINRNFFAEYAVAVLPLSVWLLTCHTAARYSGWVALSVAFNLTAVLMTGTRSALIALAFMLPCLLVVLIRYRARLPSAGWAYRDKVRVGLIFLLGLTLLGNLPSANPAVLQEGTGATPLQRSFFRTASMARATEYTEGSFSVRSTMWMATARMVIANPLAGVGAGAWEVHIPIHQRVNTTLETDYYAHNELLQLLSEYGLVVGGLCTALLLAYLIKSTAITWQAHDMSGHETLLRAVVLTSLLGQLIVSLAGFPWHLAGGGMLLALCLGILAGSDARVPSAQAGLPSGQTVLRRPKSVLALAALGLVLAIYATWQAAVAEWHIVHAVHLAEKAVRAREKNEATSPADRDAMLAHIRQGIAINPHYRRLTALVAEPLAAEGDCANAVWILESVVRSRPHVVALWSALAQCESQMGRHDRAQQAWLHVQRLKPDAAATATLAVRLRANADQFEQAIRLAQVQLDSGNFDWELTEWAYALGYKTSNWPLAIRALELRNARWPAQAADGHLRLGKIYAEPLHNVDQALLEFRAGLAAVPQNHREDFIRQVPAALRPQM